jgi:hypothetical protein
MSEKQSYEYEGYTIRFNSRTERWEVLWHQRVQAGDFPRGADAEQWVDDQMPLNR